MQVRANGGIYPGGAGRLDGNDLPRAPRQRGSVAAPARRRAASSRAREDRPPGDGALGLTSSSSRFRVGRRHELEAGARCVAVCRIPAAGEELGECRVRAGLPRTRRRSVRSANPFPMHRPRLVTVRAASRNCALKITFARLQKWVNPAPRQPPPRRRCGSRLRGGNGARRSTVTPAGYP